MSATLLRLFDREGSMVNELPISKMDEYLLNVPDDFDGSFQLTVLEEGAVIGCQPVPRPTMRASNAPLCPLCSGVVGTCEDHTAAEWKNAALRLNNPE